MQEQCPPLTGRSGNRLLAEPKSGSEPGPTPRACRRYSQQYRVTDVKVFLDSRRARHAATVATLAVVCAGGCSTQSFGVASLNPFSKPTEAVAAAEPAASPAPGKLAAVREAATGQVNNLSMATSSAWNKTKNGVTGLFGGATTGDEVADPTAENDPTRLSSPASVSPEVFVAQGALWETTGDFTKAMESYTRALQTEPRNAPALASVARLQMRQEDYVAAVESFAKAIEVNASDAALHNDYGMARARVGDMAGASESINQALALSPNTSRFANNLANVKFDAGDADAALQVLMDHNKPPVAHFNMAYLHYRGGNYAEAKKQLNEVLKFEPMAGTDSSIAQAVSRSREMLNQIDGGATRIAQVGSSAITTTNEIINSFNAQYPVRATTDQASPGGQTPQANQAGAFALPPGVFDQPIE